MCGIFAYLNFMTPATRADILAKLINGLKILEQRGCDSVGVGIDDPVKGDSKIALLRQLGKVQALQDHLDEHWSTLSPETELLTHVGLAHTRWATHGPPSEKNAHPQASDSDKHEFVVVHNGIINNAKDLKRFLTKKGLADNLSSDTDTEIIVRLVKHLYDQNPNLTFRELIEQASLRLEGAFALCFKSVHFPGECVATKRGSPLLVGIKSQEKMTASHIPIFYSEGSEAKARSKDGNAAGELHPHGPSGGLRSELLRRNDSTTEYMSDHQAVEYYFASDARTIIEYTNKVIYLEDDDVAAVSNDGKLTVHRLSSKSKVKQLKEIETLLETELQEISLGNYSSFMMKEINEQPDAIRNAMRGRVPIDDQDPIVVLGGIKDFIPEIRRCRRLLLIACGTSYHAGIGSRQILEELTELPVTVDFASDFLDRKTPVFRDDVCFLLSQSGETSETLQALRYCAERGALTVGLTNCVGSSLSRESHCGVHLNAGPEIGVASTKAYTSQLVILLLFALVMSDDLVSLANRRSEILKALKQLPTQIEHLLNTLKLEKLAENLEQTTSVLVMGRGYYYATALEGALKLKELTYVHSEAVASGELKHGPLAMIDANMSLIMLVAKDDTYEKSLNVLQQVVARGGRPLLICESGVMEDVRSFYVDAQCIEIPRTVDCLQGVLAILPLQLLAYHIARLKGHSVDTPRNLAKSVTTE